MDCFWAMCSNRRRCGEFGSCVAKAQAGGATFDIAERDNLGRRVNAVDMPEALKDMIATCYGLLWEVETDNKRVHRARRGLLQWLTKDEQARGIEMARGVLSMSSQDRGTP